MKHLGLVWFVVLVAVFLSLGGCASSDERDGPISYADPAADIHMFPNKPMPQRTKQDPNYPFFYKQCKLARRDEHLSRTEYTCDFVQ